MRAHRIASLVAASLIVSGATFAQVGRGWSDWPTSYADAQRTSWLRTDPKISVESMSEPGFELQWTSKLDNQSRGLAGPHAGCDRKRRHALRADVTRGWQLEQPLHARQRHRLRRLVAHVRGHAARGDGRLQRGHYGGADAHRERGGSADIAGRYGRDARRPRQSAGLSQCCLASPARVFPSRLAAAGPVVRARARPARQGGAPARRCTGSLHGRTYSWRTERRWRRPRPSDGRVRGRR